MTNTGGPGKDDLKGSDSAPIKVMLDLTRADLDAETRRRLEGLGLQITRVIGNKILGAIDAARLLDLKADPTVRTLETSTQLRPLGG